MRHADALAIFYRDMAGDQRPVGVPFMDPDTGVWIVKLGPGEHRRATEREIQSHVHTTDAEERKLTESSQEQKEQTWHYPDV